MKRRDVFLFLIIIILIAMLSGGAASSGYLVFNVQWLFWAYSMAVFALAGYSFILIIRSGVRPEGMKRKKKQGNLLLRALAYLTSFALVVFIFEMFRMRHHSTSSNKTSALANSHPFNLPLPKVGIILKDVPINMTLYLIPYLLLLAFVIAGLLMLRKRRLERSEIAKRFNPELTYDSLEGPPAERVIKMYKNVVAGLVRKGYPYQKSWTHWEHEDKLREIFPDLEDLDVLTKLFEKAKYAERLSGGDVDVAKRSYDRIMEFLR